MTYFCHTIPSCSPKYETVIISHFPYMIVLLMIYEKTYQFFLTEHLMKAWIVFNKYDLAT